MQDLTPSPIDSGWREVADTALAFVERFAPAGEPVRAEASRTDLAATRS